MTDFWNKRLNGAQQPIHPSVTPYNRVTAPEPQQGNSPWWIAAPPVPTGPSVDQYVPGRDGPAIEELARMDASTLSQEALELIASYKLKANKKYDNQCPHCGAANGLMQATRSTAPRCVECGYSERAVHEQLQPLTKLRPGKDILHARSFAGGNIGDSGGFQHRSQSQYLSEQGGPGY